MSLHVQELNLSKPEPNSLLRDVVDQDEWVRYITQGYVMQERHPDGETFLFHYTDLAAREERWDKITMLARGLVVRDGRVLARPLAKAWRINTPSIPETMQGNLGEAPVEMAMVPDGVEVKLYVGLHGPEFAEREKLVSRATLWAGGYYRKHLRKAIWPEGWTVVFHVVGPKFVRVIEYLKEELVLVGMVENATGKEMELEQVRGWGRENGVGVVLPWKGTLAEAVTSMHEAKGVVGRWNLGDGPPLKVMVPEVGYEETARLVRTVTPVGIWDIIRKGGELEGLREMALPKGFRDWVFGWEQKIRTAKVQMEADALEIFSQVGMKDIPPGDRKERARVAEEFKTRAEGREYLLPLLFAMLMDNTPVDNYSWAAVKKVALEGEMRWEG